MKFRNPETGEIFCSIIRLLNSFCDGRTCTGCALREPVIACADTYHCYVWVVEHPAEAARLMGYEILDDTSIDTPTNQLDSSTKVVGIDPVKPLEIEEVKYLESEAMKEYANEHQNPPGR